MRTWSIVLLCLLGLVLSAGSARAHLAVASGDGSGALRVVTSGDLATDLVATGVPGITAVLYGDLLTTATGNEMAVAAGSVLSIYNDDLSTLYLARDFGAGATINSLAMGDCRTDLSGPELAAGVTNAGAGLLYIMNPDSWTLGEVNGTGAGSQVSAVALADVNASNPGDEILFTWEYTPGFVQIACWGVSAGGFAGLGIRNVEGVCEDGLAIGDLTDDGVDDVVVALNNGNVFALEPNQGAGELALIGWFSVNPASAQAAIGELMASHAGPEVVIGSSEGGVRIVDQFNLDGTLPNFLVDTVASAGVEQLVLGDFADENYHTTDIAIGASDGLLQVLSFVVDTTNTLTTTESRGGFGSFADLKEVPSEALVPVELGGLELQ